MRRRCRCVFLCYIILYNGAGVSFRSVVCVLSVYVCVETYIYIYVCMCL